MSASQPSARWADFAINEQHVITYQVSVLSPEILKPNTLEQKDLIASIEILRPKANRVLANIDTIAKLPGANLVRTPNKRASLEEVRMRIIEQWLLGEFRGSFLL